MSQSQNNSLVTIACLSYLVCYVCDRGNEGPMLVPARKRNLSKLYPSSGHMSLHRRTALVTTPSVKWPTILFLYDNQAIIKTLNELQLSSCTQSCFATIITLHHYIPWCNIVLKIITSSAKQICFVFKSSVSLFNVYISKCKNTELKWQVVGSITGYIHILTQLHTIQGQFRGHQSVVELVVNAGYIVPCTHL